MVYFWICFGNAWIVWNLRHTHTCIDLIICTRFVCSWIGWSSGNNTSISTHAICMNRAPFDGAFVLKTADRQCRLVEFWHYFMCIPTDHHSYSEGEFIDWQPQIGKHVHIFHFGFDLWLSIFKYWRLIIALTFISMIWWAVVNAPQFGRKQKRKWNIRWVIFSTPC